MRLSRKIDPTEHRGRGRPREFDMDEALDKAIKIFCLRGYHATSIPELSKAMGLASGSIYKAFSDKRAVFLAAFDRQAEVRGVQLQAALDSVSTGKEKVRQALEFYARISTGADGRHGCLVVSTAVEMASFDSEIAERAVSALNRREKLLVELIRIGQDDGSIPSSLDKNGAAKFMLCLLQGLRVVGKTSPDKETMVAAVNIAMKALD